jgi:hypothetical protein
MLEATNVDLVFTISLKRSTLNRHLYTSRQADYPIFGSEAVIQPRSALSQKRAFDNPQLLILAASEPHLVCTPVYGA